AGLRGVTPRAGARDAGALQRLERLAQPGAPEIEDVVVGQHTHIETRRGEARDIVRVHAIVNALVWRIVIAARDARLEVDDAQGGRVAFPFGERVSPDVGRIDGTRDGARRLFGELH